MTSTPKFSPETIEFLRKASRQKRDNWLDKNRESYEKLLLKPIQNLARHLKSELGSLAPSYNFPQKGLARLKRSAGSIAQQGGGHYKSWISYSAARPRQSRFETNPNIFFLINSEDKADPILIAGGLYMPSSKQMRALREALARDASAFEELFASTEFARSFPEGFSPEKRSSRVPRGVDPNHPKIEWIKLQAFFVWKPYSRKEFASRQFPELVARDGKQILRLNKLLEKALHEKPRASAPKARTSSSLLDRLDELGGFEPKMDF